MSLRLTVSILIALCAAGVNAQGRSNPWPDLSAARPIGGGEKDVAIVIAIERYAFAAAVPGAERNAEDWYRYFTRTRKVPASRVRLIRGTEATLEEMREQLKWAATAADPEGTLWFVFIGHGAPARDGQDGVLVGMDAQQTVQSLYARSLPQKEVLGELERGRQKQSVLVLDACFSGRSGTGEQLVPGIQPMVPVRREAQLKKSIVFTAARSNQFAGSLPGETRPAFSYLMLGALRGWAAGGDDTVTAAEAIQYVQEALGTVLRGRQQIPELHGAAGGAILSLRAKERGPDLSEIVLSVDDEPAPSTPQKSELAFTTKLDIEVPKIQLKPSESVALDAINLSAERLLEQAVDAEEKEGAGNVDAKLKSWCALAAVKDRNPYLSQAIQACREWSAYRVKRQAFEKNLSKDYETLSGYLALKRKTDEQKLAVVDAFLNTYGSLDDDRVNEAHAEKRRLGKQGRAPKAQVSSDPGPAAVLGKPPAAGEDRGPYYLQVAREALLRGDRTAARTALKEAQASGWNDLDLQATLGTE